MSSEQKTEMLEEMLNRVKPKARYMSEMHVEDNIDSLMKEIVNGDIYIPEQQTKIDQELLAKRNYEVDIRGKFLTKVQKQKVELEHKLSYITNSINAMKKYEFLNNGSPILRYNSSNRSSATMFLNEASKERELAWKKELGQRGKSIEVKKKKVEEIHQKKQQEMKELQEQKHKQQQAQKKKQILQKMQKIQERVERREVQNKSCNQRLKQVKKQPKAFEKLNSSYQQRQISELQERKKKLAEIRNIHKPIDANQIQQHEQRFVQIKKQKQQLREREKRMNESRSRSYRAPYQSVYYKKVAEANDEESQNLERVKRDKMKQFSEHVKSNFVPEVDQKKKRQLEERLEKQEQRVKYWEDKHQQLLEMPKLKGLEYLELIRKIPKKRTGTSSPESMNRGNISERTKYANYLTRSVNMSEHQPWKTILKSSGDRQEKALKLHFESEKVEQELKRKEQMTRLMKQTDTGEIDQQYYQMIKAKLDLLQTPN